MKLSEVCVKNYKGLRDVTVPLSQFACVIGHNNAGKSTLLQSLILFIEGKKLTPSHYYDTNQEIIVAVTITDVSEDDLQLVVNEDHRERLRAGLTDSSLKLVRRYGIDGSSKLRWKVAVPKDERFQTASIDALLKGKKPSTSFAEEVEGVYPELSGKLGARPNQSHVRELISELVRSLPAEDMLVDETELPTGYDASVRALLPEPIYIPAVKDFSDDIKTKESTSFGKIIGILLNAIAPELSEADEAFKLLNKKLNILLLPNGTTSDDRLDAVQRIESMVRSLVREHFPAVDIELQIPPPEIKTILSSARILVDDGVKGELEAKGDGLRRSVAFAILRGIAQLKRDPSFNPQVKKTNAGFLLLFEEPELYLHPKAQRVLFDALRVISETDQVLVSTHSPLFFSHRCTETFIKMVKTQGEVGQKPFGQALQVDLSKLDDKASFQLLSFELNDYAFFSRTIVLVEGDTDHLVFPHMAKVLNPTWCVDREDISICRVHGKGNIPRYTKFLKSLQVRVVVLADLDCLLEGFDRLGGSEACSKLRNQLLARIDKVLAKEIEEGDFGEDAEELRQQLIERGTADLAISNLSQLAQRKIISMSTSPIKKGQWDDLIDKFNRVLSGEGTFEDLKRSGDAFFDKQIAKNRQLVLERGDDPETERLKHSVLISLRESDIFLLSRGSIEKYLPSHISGRDKTSKALTFCETVCERDDILSLCDEVPTNAEGGVQNELECLFSRIFTNAQQSTVA
ncbi:ATP-dependent nuclease [Paludisphaera borealis]|uniref:Uncharacterized protein n=1 Tax=Paludisphaera borealis TaxID=1387353 RepID=A0A1U7CRM7_9BACT|nr:AAA family ATPase [Paludisphaera borealis]APW61558.1 hypothetical protein BSF38_03076 [Paludisphaera borealis]